MKISVIGAGYVGLTTAVCLADVGHQIVCIDIDREKVKLINECNPPFYEKGMVELLRRNFALGRLKVTTNYEDLLGTELTFVATGTPVDHVGNVVLNQVKDAIKKVSELLRKKKDYHVIVIKSTVPPGTTKEILIPLIERFSKKKVPKQVGVCVNPEFLREGNAIQDFIKPDRVVIGEPENDKKAGDLLTKVFEKFSSRFPYIRTGLTEAEMIKCAANAFLCTKVSFANEIGTICKLFGIDGKTVMRGLLLDHRFGKSHWIPGSPYGGSCLPKDIKILINWVKKRKKYNPILLQAVEEINKLQLERIIDLCESVLGKLKDKRICILGLSFKAGTNDIRNSIAIDIIKKLIERGANVVVYDPMALEITKNILGDRVEYFKNEKKEKVLENADCCIITTEWEEFSDILAKGHKFMRNKILIDIKRLIEREFAEALGFTYLHL